ncbi:MAG: hypothetical protein CMP48_23995 [Rickettsiales bacterium]|nr:hypothetical protein [Rickettsiales bacterium]
MKNFNKPIYMIQALILFFLVGMSSCNTTQMTSGNEIIDVASEANLNSGNGNKYYVAVDGDDSNDGTVDYPFATIQHAIDLAVPGDKVIVREGSYHQEVTIQQSGTAKDPIILMGYPEETVIIDGESTLPVGEYPGVKYNGMIDITGSYIEVKDLIIQYSKGRGVAVVDAVGVVLEGLEAFHNWNAGVHVLRSESVTVENCEIWENAYSNAPPNRRKETWSPALNNVESTNSIIRNNRIYQNYGEGFDDLRSSYSTIENNISYDNWAVNLYLDNSQYTLLNGNISYATDNTLFWRYADNNPPQPSPGIILNDEPWAIDNHTSNVVVSNNMIYNQATAIGIWGVDGADNILIANNTIINTLEGESGNQSNGILLRGSAIIENSRIINNVVYFESFGPVITGSSDGYSFSHNNWSAEVGPAFSGEGDIVCDPALAMVGSTAAGELAYDFFRLTTESPGIDAAMILDEVRRDADNRENDAKPDLGALKFFGQKGKSACEGDDELDLTYVSFVSVEDTYTNEGQPDNSYPNANNLQSNAAIGFRKTPFLKFDVSGISGTVASVKLKLYVLRGEAAGTSLVQSIPNDWSESSITWNNMPAGETTVGNFAHVAVGEYVEVELSPDFVSSDGTYSIVLDASGTTSRIDYASSEHATVEFRPVLEIGFH